MTIKRTLALIICTALFAVTMLGVASAKEKKIQRADLPPAVEKTVAAQAQGATVRGFSTETEKGKTFYEAELTVAGHSKDVLIDGSGAVVEVEEQVDLAALPDAVKQGLQKKAGKGEILKVESLTKKGKLVAYEAVVKTAVVKTKDKRTEIQVGPDGQPLAHEE
jgi:hypothetical protein